jgi:hypothetical protein
MYCPKCASQGVPGQRFCRNCGTNLGLILDAMEGKQRGPLDFESLKRDLRDLGASLRTGFVEASAAIKNTSKLDKSTSSSAPAAPQAVNVVNVDWSRELNKALKKVRAANSRKYSFQQAALSIFGGSAMVGVWYYLLQAAADSGLLRSLELIILENTGAPVFGLVPIIQMLWMLGLIPIARGVAHLVNGIFFAPKQEKEPEPQTSSFTQSYFQPSPDYVSPISGVTTGELELEEERKPKSSVTEDATLRFEPK